MPTLSNWRYHQTLAKLNAYVENQVRQRWLKRQQGYVQKRQDILDRVLEAVDPNDWSEVRILANVRLSCHCGFGCAFLPYAS